MICNPFSVIEVPFPFSDRDKAKRRKALILSSRLYNETNAASVMMMITSAHAGSWLGDIPLKNWKSAGLKKPCIARARFFTLDNALIIAQIGDIAPADRSEILKALKSILPG